MAQIYRLNESLCAPMIEGAACAFGVFDGLHKGHQFIINGMIEWARKDDAPAVILTFDVDPDELFCPDKLKKLMTNEDRIARLAELDVDAVVLIPFSHDIASFEASSFLEQCLGQNVPSSLHIGHDFRFGKHAAGTVADLVQWGLVHGMHVEPYKLLQALDADVTATRIRNLLAQADIESANTLLTRSYSVKGIVQKGRGEGADMGFATANLLVPAQLRTLADGVYAAYASINGETYKAAVSVGVSPTFADTATANMEIHVLDFQGDLYDQEVEVSFIYYLRPMMTFDSVDELIKTVMGNIAWVQEHL